MPEYHEWRIWARLVPEWVGADREDENGFPVPQTLPAGGVVLSVERPIHGTDSVSSLNLVWGPTLSGGGWRPLRTQPGFGLGDDRGTSLMEAVELCGGIGVRVPEGLGSAVADLVGDVRELLLALEVMES